MATKWFNSLDTNSRKDPKDHQEERISGGKFLKRLKRKYPQDPQDSQDEYFSRFSRGKILEIFKRKDPQEPQEKRSSSRASRGNSLKSLKRFTPKVRWLGLNCSSESCELTGWEISEMHPPKLRSEQQGAEAKGQKRRKYGSYGTIS